MNRDLVLLRHILDAIGKIETYISVGKERFFAESHWQDAVIRQLEIVGEATKGLSDAIRLEYQDVPWRRISGMRDILVHEYFRVDVLAVWEAAQKDVPFLATRVREIIGDLDQARPGSN